MGKLVAGERDPDSIFTRTDFAQALTALRQAAGFSVRSLAAKAEVPSATIGGYLSGRHLPPASQLWLLRKMLGACGVDTNADFQRWVDALRRARLNADGRIAKPSAPYRGLAPYGPDDSPWFFGREKATAAVLRRLAALRDEPGPSHGILAVVGPSGSGKSSLLRAGVAAQIRDGVLDDRGKHWTAVSVSPDDSQFDGVFDLLATVPDEWHVLIVDQLEELFTVCTPTRRVSFLQQLAELDPSRVLVVVGLRADFFAAAAQQPILLTALQHAQFVLGPMTETELRAAIVEPARVVGAAVDDGLVELLLAELAPHGTQDTEYDAGALPFLSHALLATFERADRNLLTVADYRATGGVRGSIRQTAEESFVGLSPAEQELARRIFLRMINVEDDGVFTRRRLPAKELAGLVKQPNGPTAQTVLDRFIDCRLLTAHTDSIELSHEALLTAWPRLYEWCEADRHGLRLHHQLTDAANSWQAGERDNGLLLRGTRLTTIAEWAEHPARRSRLNQLECDYLNASVARAEAERESERRRTRRLHQLIAALTVLSLLTASALVYALKARAGAIHDRDEALSRQVAIEATQLRGTDPGLAAQLAVAAYQISPTTDATSVLLDSTAGDLPTRMLGPAGVTNVSISPDGHLLAASHADDGSIHLYTMKARSLTPTATLAGIKPSAQIFALAISPDGNTLAAGGSDDKVTLWNIGDPAHPSRLESLGGFTNAVHAIAFSPDGNFLAGAGDDKAVRLWKIGDVVHPRETAVLPLPAGNSMQALAYDPAGDELAAAGDGGALRIWHLDHDGAAHLLAATNIGSSPLTSAAFAPTGRLLAVGSKERLVHLLSIDVSGQPHENTPALGGFTSWVNVVGFSHNGRYLAAGSSDNSLRLWDTGTWAAVATFEHPGPVTGVSFSADDRLVVSAATDGAIRLWALPSAAIPNKSGNVFVLGYGGDGHVLAVIASATQGGAALWDTTNPSSPVKLADVPLPTDFGAVAGAGALTSDGHLLAVANRKADIQLLDTTDPRHPAPLGAPLHGASPLVEQMAFNPRATLLAAGDDQGSVHVWDVTNRASPKALPTLTGPGSMVLDVAFSPNGKLLAAASADKTVWLWDISQPRAPKKLAVLAGFANYAYTVAFTPDGRTLAAGSADGTIRLWNVVDPTMPRLLGNPLTGPTAYVYSIAISPDGKTLAAGSTDNTVWLWDIVHPAMPHHIATLRVPSAPVFFVAYGGGGNVLAAGGADQSVHFWTPQIPAAMTRICSTAGAGITRAEWAKYIQGAPYDPPCH